MHKRKTARFCNVLEHKGSMREVNFTKSAGCARHSRVGLQRVGRRELLRHGAVHTAVRRLAVLEKARAGLGRVDAALGVRSSRGGGGGVLPGSGRRLEVSDDPPGQKPKRSDHLPHFPRNQAAHTHTHTHTHTHRAPPTHSASHRNAVTRLWI